MTRIDFHGIAVGYIRLDISGDSEEQHKVAIRELAAKWRYRIAWILLLDEYTDDPVDVLLQTVTKYTADAVFVPSARHFEGCMVPEILVDRCNVVTVADKQTYARPLSPSEFRSSTPPMKEMK